MLNKRELEVIEEIKNGLDSDLPMMSFGTSKYFSEELSKINRGVSLVDAPFNEPLVVISTRLSPFYYDYGEVGCAIGSVLVKKSELQVSFIYAHDWIKLHGFLKKEKIVGSYQMKDDLQGKVVRLKDIKLPELF